MLTASVVFVYANTSSQGNPSWFDGEESLLGTEVTDLFDSEESLLGKQVIDLFDWEESLPSKSLCAMAVVQLSVGGFCYATREPKKVLVDNLLH